MPIFVLLIRTFSTKQTNLDGVGPGCWLSEWVVALATVGFGKGEPADSGDM